MLKKFAFCVAFEVCKVIKMKKCMFLTIIDTSY